MVLKFMLLENFIIKLYRAAALNPTDNFNVIYMKIWDIKS